MFQIQVKLSFVYFKKSKLLFRPWRDRPLWDADAKQIKQWFEKGKYKKLSRKFANKDGSLLFQYSRKDFLSICGADGIDLYRDLNLVIKKEKTKTILFCLFIPLFQ